MKQSQAVKNIGIGGATATILIWIWGYYEPELIATLPTGGEAALATIFTAIFQFIREKFE